MAQCRCGALAKEACPQCLQVRCGQHLHRSAVGCAYCAAEQRAARSNFARSKDGAAQSRLLEIQSRMIVTAATFARVRLRDVRTNSRVSRPSSPRSSARGSTKTAFGWVLATDTQHGVSGHPCDAVLTPTGEIFCSHGCSRLVHDEVTTDARQLVSWFDQAMVRYEVRQWPNNVDDLRCLVIDFEFSVKRGLTARYRAS